jgi:hypothetical protein
MFSLWGVQNALKILSCPSKCNLAYCSSCNKHVIWSYMVGMTVQVSDDKECGRWSAWSSLIWVRSALEFDRVWSMMFKGLMNWSISISWLMENIAKMFEEILRRLSSINMVRELSRARYCTIMLQNVFEVVRGQLDCCIDLLSTMQKMLACVPSTTCDVDISLFLQIFLLMIVLIPPALRC